MACTFRKAGSVFIAFCMLMTMLPAAALAEDSTAAPSTEIVSPADGGTSEVPPVDDGTGEVPPADDGTGEVPPVDDGTGEVPPADDGTGEVPPVDDGMGEVPPADSGTSEVPPVDDGTGEVPPTDGVTSEVPPADSGVPEAAPAVDAALPAVALPLPETVGTFTVTYTMVDGLEEHYSFNRGQPGPVTSNPYSCGATVASFGVFLKDLETNEFEKAVVMTLLSDVTGYEKNSKVERTYTAGTVVSAFDGTDAKVKYGGYSPDGGGFGFTSFPDGTEVEIELSLVYPETSEVPETGSLTVSVVAAGVDQLPQAYEAVLTVECAADETAKTYILSDWTAAEERSGATWTATCSVEDLLPGDYQVTLTGVSNVDGYEAPTLAQTQTLTVTAEELATATLDAVYIPAVAGGEPEQPETEQPGDETEQPGGEAEQPGGEAEQPGGETEQPGGEAEQPGGETEQPGSEAEQPGGETEQPSGETEQPGGEAEQPGGETDQPDNVGGEPEGRTERVEAPSAPADKGGAPNAVDILDTGVPQAGILDTIISLDDLAEIADEAPPLAALPETGGAGSQGAEVIIIDPTELPLGDLPQTGTQAGANSASLTLAGLMCLLGGAGGLLLGRKKES